MSHALGVAEALPPGAVLMTVNQRLAASLVRRYDAGQVAQGHRSWSTPDILPLSAWLRRCQETVWPGHTVLSENQALLVWERIVVESAHGEGLLSPTQAARKAWQAWGLMQAWQVPLEGVQTAEVAVFQDWLNTFQEKCQRHQWWDGQALTGAVADWIERGDIAPPNGLWLAGFDLLAPDLKRLLVALEQRGCPVTVWQPSKTADPQVSRLRFDTPEQEARYAARWARQRLHDGQRVAIVVPELAQYRAVVVRALTETLAPGCVPGCGDPVGMNISLGEPLADIPLVSGALLLLSVGFAPVPVERCLMLLNGPYLDVAEQAGRARLAARIGGRRHGDMALSELLRQVSQTTPALTDTARFLTHWIAQLAAQREGLRPSRWARLFSTLLDELGWPGAVALDSPSYQAKTAWIDLLGTFSGLDVVGQSWSRREAVAQLNALAARAVFQPEGEGGVQVLGVLEAAGMAFDEVWLMGMDDLSWPPAPSPNPFLPLATQRTMGLPHASAEVELGFARRVTGRLLQAAPRVVVSSALEVQSRPVGVSPLLAHIEESAAHTLAVAAEVNYALQMATPGATEVLVDDAAPALAAGEAGVGGVSLFKDQAACPFRGFALHRLLIREAGEAGPGLDARDRGNELHKALEIVWGRLGGLDGLEQAQDLAAIIADAVERTLLPICREAGLSDGFMRVERVRLQRRVGEWLDQERQRAPFTVLAVEAAQQIEVGGVTVNTKIDRIDRLTDGREVLIDYKTGSVAINKWFGERPDEPQLPLYLTARQAPVAALAFAQLRPGDMRFSGLSDGPGVLPRVKDVVDVKTVDAATWGALVAGWKRVLEALGEAYVRGDAAVLPKDAPTTCRYCPLDPLCRIWEQDRLDSGEGETA